MMCHKGFVRALRLALFGAIVSGSTGAEAASKKASLGHKRYADGRYGDAVTAYEEALAAGEREPAVTYNLGNARYRAAGADTAQVRSALTDWQRAAAGASGELRANSLYNAGNASFRLGDLQEAESFYEDVLRQNPADEDARYNLELVQRLIQQQPQQEGGGADSSKAGDRSQQPDSTKGSSGDPGGRSKPDPGNDPSQPPPDQPPGTPNEEPPQAGEQQPNPQGAGQSSPSEAPQATEPQAGANESDDASVQEALRQLAKLEEAEREHLRELLLAKRRKADVDKDW